MSLISTFFKSRNDRILKKLNKRADKILSLVDNMKNCSENDLREKTSQFKDNIKSGQDLNSIVDEALAVACVGAQKALGLSAFKVQIIGALVLLDKKIAEMRTGEGKTLTAALAAYVAALEGRGVHVVTVNDYLARRDSKTMGKLFNLLGLSVGVVINKDTPENKREAYNQDITYATNADIGFDYLNDNMSQDVKNKMQRGLHFAIVDEVDSILIDEARTPLIISGQVEDSVDTYNVMDGIAKLLERQEDEYEGEGDFWTDDKRKQAHLTEKGLDKVESIMVERGILEEGDSLFAAHNINLIYHLEAALRANSIYRRDIDYLVRDGKVEIIDEFTGRVMKGRRWSKGLHQAIEAKEGVDIQPENQAVASITLQNLFRMYDNLAGMTGTADTEAYEFMDIYGLEVVVIPTHKPMVRVDYPDMVFINKKGKMKRLVEDLIERHKTGQPVLVGTATVETSEYISNMLKSQNIEHNVLNAKQHEKEAQIIANAGKIGAITIATNMAGRGTDIVLGGSFESIVEHLGEDASEEDKRKAKDKWIEEHNKVVELGGLHVIGSDRHESRRIDNQLRGRAGRQGDKGSSQFYVSFEDDLIRLFAPSWASSTLKGMGMGEDDVISVPMVAKQIENAQRKVESHNFDIRKNLLTYDDVANNQRSAFYSWRDLILQEEDLKDDLYSITQEVIRKNVSAVYNQHLNDLDTPLWQDLNNLMTELNMPSSLPTVIKLKNLTVEDIEKEQMIALLQDEFESWCEDKREKLGDDEWNNRVRMCILDASDKQWREHISKMDLLRAGIQLRSFAQKKPEQEYKREAFELFNQMLDDARGNTLKYVVMMLEAQRDENGGYIQKHIWERKQKREWNREYSINMLQGLIDKNYKLVKVDNYKYTDNIKIDYSGNIKM